jgi:ABC-type transport system involved in multi-copper enzyme maturation permease subunit
VIVLALFSTILTAVCAFIIGIWGDTPVSFENFRYIGYFFIQAVSYIGLSFLFALILKKSALTIGIFFIYSLIIENILDKYLNKINIDIGIDNLGHLLPLSSSDHLLIFSDLKTMMSMTGMGASEPEYVYLTASVIYIILCGLACYYRYKKQDL